jgi:hypothetical protein
LGGFRAEDSEFSEREAGGFLTEFTELWGTEFTEFLWGRVSHRGLQRMGKRGGSDGIYGIMGNGIYGISLEDGRGFLTD